jgi:hypothetical protein
MNAPAPPPRRRLSWRWKLTLALVPVTVLFALTEAWARRFRLHQGMSPFRAGSYRDVRIDLIRRGYPTAHDPLLGYVPRPGFASTDNPWRVPLSIDAEGCRSNGPDPRPPGERELLTVGDSFTFGDQVGDADTWPAALQRLLATPVRNAGVFGYSFAQIVLRAEQMLARHPTAGVVASLIPDDLHRCEMKKRFTPVPWFGLEHGALVLRGVPVPDSTHTRLDDDLLRQLMGHSALLDMLFWNAVPRWWVGEERVEYAHEPGSGVTLGKLLLDRLHAECERRGARLLLVLQGDAPTDGALELLAHATARGVPVLDLASRFASLAAADPGLHARYFHGHMTKAGNLWVAEQIAAAWR